MNEIVVVTANFGGIDHIAALPPGAGIDGLYYTDAATRAATAPGVLASWTRVVVPNYPRHDFNARLRGRYFKHQIHRLPETRPYRWLVWADATVAFKDTAFLIEAAARLAACPPHERMLTIPHPERKTVREEYDYIRGEIARGSEYLRIRYADEKMDEQMAFFESEGMDVDAPLWCGTLWMVENTPHLHALLDAWWDQNLRFGMMDQLSLPVLLNAHGVTPQPLDIELRRNAYFDWLSHRLLA